MRLFTCAVLGGLFLASGAFAMTETVEGSVTAYTRTFTLDQAGCTAQLAVRGATRCDFVEVPAKATDLLVAGTKVELGTGPGAGPIGGCKIQVSTSANGYSLVFVAGVGAGASDPQSCFRDALHAPPRPGQTSLASVVLTSVIYRTP